MTVEQMWHAVPGGSGEYVAELARALATDTGVDLVPLAARHTPGAPGGTPLPTVHTSRLPRPVLYGAWNRLRRPSAEGLAGGYVDVVHATTWAVPGRSAPLVATVHDLAFLRDPGHFTARGRRYFRRAWSVVRDEAAVVVVPSSATRDDCVANGLDATRVRMIPHGVRVSAVDVGEVAAWRSRQGLDCPYVLWCGTLEPRKNVERLVEAFVDVRRSGLEADLVLVGPTGWGGTAGRVAAAAEAAPPGSVHLLGRLPRHELDLAYAGAAAFAYPSLWEGYGMPVLEAMAHGAPVVTSAGTSTAEVAGGLATLVDPLDVASIAAELGAVLAAGRAAGELERRAWAASHTWQASAEAHAVVYRDVARL